MASAIEYTYKCLESLELPSDIFWFTEPQKLSVSLPFVTVSPELPEDMNDISEIYLNISGQWVRVCSMNHPGVVWELLSYGMPKPHDMEYSTAALFAAAIWLDTILHSDCVKGHPVVLTTCFYDAIGHEVEGDTDFETSFAGTALGWNDFNDIAFDAGVDFRLRAWLDGVPLEHVLAE